MSHFYWKVVAALHYDHQKVPHKTFITKLLLTLCSTVQFLPCDCSVGKPINLIVHHKLTHTQLKTTVTLSLWMQNFYSHKENNCLARSLGYLQQDNHGWFGYGGCCVKQQHWKECRLEVNAFLAIKLNFCVCFESMCFRKITKIHIWSDTPKSSLIKKI